MIDTDKYEEFENAMNEGRIERVHCLWALAEVKRLRRAFRIATAHIGFGNHLGHAELRHALNSMGIDYNSLPWADEEWEEPLPTFGGVAHYD